MRSRPAAVSSTVSSMLVAAAVILLAALPACATRRRGGEAPRAVVLFEPTRKDDAATARRLLAEEGWNVWVEPSGTVRRSRSSLALYGLARRDAAAVAEEAAALLAPLGPFVEPGATGDEGSRAIERLPFAQPGPPGISAVLWLAD